MTARLSITSLAAAVVLAMAASPAFALSDDVHTVNQMRAANIANAKKLLDQEGGSRVVFKVDADALRTATMTGERGRAMREIRSSIYTCGIFAIPV